MVSSNLVALRHLSIYGRSSKNMSVVRLELLVNVLMKC